MAVFSHLIHKLPDVVINQIAAGEVVERPVSVVKELCENALDAGATRIDVALLEGGTKSIVVSDNGGGMSKDDLSCAVTRHFTSKISQTDDLSTISSFGFRGEALASIASVSDFSIASRLSGQEDGYKLSIKNSEQSLDPFGMPQGTHVTVEYLFANVPARQKFMKRAATEYSHVLAFMQQVALVYPHVAFTLSKDGGETFSTSGKGDDAQLLESILGKDLANSMLPVLLEEPHISISGWVGKPGVASASRPKQFLFVNNRIVYHRGIFAAVMQGYSSLVGRHEKPQFVLKINVSPHIVDVNVHPQKREVRFVEEQFVFAKVKQAVGIALSGQQPYQKEAFTETSQANHQPFGSSLGSSKPATVAPLQKPMWNGSVGAGGFSGGQYRPFQTPISFENAASPDVFETSDEDFPTYQLMRLFIVEDHGTFITVYDQHAVHERVLYEQCSSYYIDKKNSVPTQPLLVEKSYKTIDLTPNDDVYRELVKSLELTGFMFTETEDVVTITAVPVSFLSISIDVFLQESIKDLTDSIEVGTSETKEIDDQTHRRLAIMSCRGAIKAGDPLSTFEAKQLIKQFHQTSNNATCPHGRPVEVTLTKEEMMGWFKR